MGVTPPFAVVSSTSLSLSLSLAISLSLSFCISLSLSICLSVSLYLSLVCLYHCHSLSRSTCVSVLSSISLGPPFCHPLCTSFDNAHRHSAWSKFRNSPNLPNAAYSMYPRPKASTLVRNSVRSSAVFKCYGLINVVYYFILTTLPTDIIVDKNPAKCDDVKILYECERHENQILFYKIISTAKAIKRCNT